MERGHLLRRMRVCVHGHTSTFYKHVSMSMDTKAPSVRSHPILNGLDIKTYYFQFIYLILFVFKKKDPKWNIPFDLINVRTRSRKHVLVPNAKSSVSGPGHEPCTAFCFCPEQVGFA